MKALIFVLFLFLPLISSGLISSEIHNLERPKALIEEKDISLENIPPVESLIGQPLVSEKDNQRRQFANHKNYRRHHKNYRRHHNNHRHHHRHSPQIILPLIAPPVPLVNVGSICRSNNGLLFCYQGFPTVIGTPCTCSGLFGGIWFYGNTSAF